MATIPGKKQCDLCNIEYPIEKVLRTVTIPLTREQRQLIAEDIESQQPHVASAFGGLFPLAQMLPNCWQLEVCECLDGLIPQLEEVKAARIKKWLQARRDRRQPEPEETL